MPQSIGKARGVLNQAPQGGGPVLGMTGRLAAQACCCEALAVRKGLRGLGHGPRASWGSDGKLVGLEGLRNAVGPCQSRQGNPWPTYGWSQLVP
eukprot:11054621-Alexandrium_andersonii.AAC.1